MYDIIGDIHGEYEKLCSLLSQMGYSYVDYDNAYIHRDGRQAIFVGDLIDRGPENMATVRLVQNMIQAGSAQCIMGNHEYNAVQIVTPHPSKPGEFLRPQTAGNLSQQATFSREVGFNGGMPSRDHQAVMDWFKTLPVYLMIHDMVIVHACWYPSAVKRLLAGGYMDETGRITQAGWQLEADRTTEAFEDLNTLLKGPEAEYPFDFDVKLSEYGRKKDRLAWWRDNPKTVKEAFIELPKTFNEVGALMPYDKSMQTDLMKKIRADLAGFGGLVLFGHISLGGEPAFLSPNVACVDYNAGRGGELIAYRLHGDARTPQSGHFFSEIRGNLRPSSPGNAKPLVFV